MDTHVYTESGSAGNERRGYTGGNSSGNAGGYTNGNAGGTTGGNMGMHTAGKSPVTVSVLKWMLFALCAVFTVLYLVLALLVYGTDWSVLELLALPVPFVLDFIVAAWLFASPKSQRTGWGMMILAILFTAGIIGLLLSFMNMTGWNAYSEESATGSSPFIAVSAVLLVVAAADIVLMAVLQTDMSVKFTAGVYEPKQQVHGSGASRTFWKLLTIVFAAFWIVAAFMSVEEYWFLATYYLPAVLLFIAVVLAWWYAPFRSGITAVLMTVLMLAIAAVLLGCSIAAAVSGDSWVYAAMLIVSIIWFAVLCLKTVFLFRTMRRLQKQDALQNGESQDNSQ